MIESLTIKTSPTCYCTISAIIQARVVIVRQWDRLYVLIEVCRSGQQQKSDVIWISTRFGVRWMLKVKQYFVYLRRWKFQGKQIQRNALFNMALSRNTPVRKLSGFFIIISVQLSASQFNSTYQTSMTYCPFKTQTLGIISARCIPLGLKPRARGEQVSCFLLLFSPVIR